MADPEADKKTEVVAGAKKTAPVVLRAILGEKIGMTQVYHPKDKNLYDVTVVKAGPCQILRVKSQAGPDGYNAVQLAYGERKEKNVSAPLRGQYKKAGAVAARLVREIRVGDAQGFEAGQVVEAAAIFKPGDYVDVQGTSKGKGFAGVMKRHKFRGMPGSHGASDKERSPGSLASRRALGRVLPGQRMAGRMGGETVTTLKIEVVKVEENLLYVNGAVPGPKGSFVTVSETVKAKKHRVEVVKSTVKKDKMGNIITAKKPSAPKKA